MPEIAIAAKNLTRYFGTKPVVQQVDLQIPVGSVTGLLGLNGAGKSTLIKMLMGLLAPTRGSCSLLGHESLSLSGEERARIGYTIEGHFLYSSMTVRNAELFQSESFPRWSSSIFQGTIDRFGISPKAKIRTLSRGQRAGVSIALTLSSQPELLILDDPALGLDPVSRRALNETLLSFMEGGDRTILLSSHMLDDVERVTDRVLVMVDGQILVNSSVTDFMKRVSTWSCTREDATGKFSYVPGLVFSRTVGSQLTMTVVDADEEAEAAMHRIGGRSLVRADTAFEESIIAYLSRSRSSESFLCNRPQSASSV